MDLMRKMSSSYMEQVGLSLKKYRNEILEELNALNKKILHTTSQS